MKKNILFSIGSLQIGGAETVLVDILNDLDLTKYDIDLLLIEKRGELLERLDSRINLKYLTKSDKDCSNVFIRFFNKAYRSLIYRFLANYKWYAKYVYKHVLKKEYETEVAFLMGVPNKIIKNSPYLSKKIMWLHTDVSALDHKSQKEYSNLYNNYDIIVAPSQKAYEAFNRTFKTYKGELIVLNNYLSSKKVLTLSQQASNVFPTSKKHLLAVGRLVKEKGYDRLLRVTKLLNKDYDDFDLNIIGSGPEEENLKKLCADLDLKNVNFLGLKTNPYPYFKEADIYVLSSNWEGYPTVLIEATILEKLIVATDVAGVREILDGYSKSIIVEKKDEELYLGLKKAFTMLGKDFKTHNKFTKINNENLKAITKLL